MSARSTPAPRFPAPLAWTVAPWAVGLIGALLGDLWLACYLVMGVAAVEMAVITFVWHPPLFGIALPLPVSWLVAVILWAGQGGGRPEGAAAVAGGVLTVLWVLELGLFTLGPRVAQRCLRRKIEFSDRRVHEITVAPGPDGRPGERVLAYSKTLLPTKVLDDGVRSDFRTLVGRGGSAISALCIGPSADHGDARKNAENKVGEIRARATTPVQAELVDDEIAGEAAVSIRWGGQSKYRAIDWRFCHAGWTYSAGVLCCPGDDASEMERRAREVFASWRWVEPT